MKCKLVCVDMDGTLLTSSKNVSEANKNAIKKAYKKGVEVVITTGRVFANADYYSKLIGVKSPIIASNGAIIRGKNNEIIYKNPMKIEKMEAILKVCRKLKIKVNFHTSNSIICGSKFVYILVKYLFLKSMRNSNNGKLELKYIPNYESLNKFINSNEVIRCEIININSKRIGKLKSELKKLDGIEVVGSTDRNIEVTSKSVSKGNAVKILADTYHIKREEIITIGDSENDLSMIEYGGLGVVMGNGNEKAKRIADYITDTNYNDGVAKVINKFILND